LQVSNTVPTDVAVFPASEILRDRQFESFLQEEGFEPSVRVTRLKISRGSCRSTRVRANGNFGANEKPAQAVVDHICYTVSNWDDTRVNAALKAAGTNPAGRKGSVNVYDPNGFQVQIASIEGENPFK